MTSHASAAASAIGPQVLRPAVEALDRWQRNADDEFMRGDTTRVPSPAGALKLFGVAVLWELGRATLLAKTQHRTARLLRGDTNRLIHIVYGNGGNRLDRLGADVLLCVRFIAAHLEHAGRLLEAPPSPATIRGLSNLACLLVKTTREFSLTTLAELERRANGEPRYLGGVSGRLHSRMYYEATRKAFYENVGGANFFDREPYATPLFLRAALELQLRQALDVQAFATSGGARRFVSVRDILVAAKHLNAASPVPVHRVLWMYEWCNRVVHAGYRAPLPVIWFAMEHLRPLLRGVTTEREYTAQPFVLRATREEQIAALRRQLCLDESWLPVE